MSTSDDEQKKEEEKEMTPLEKQLEKMQLFRMLQKKFRDNR